MKKALLFIALATLTFNAKPGFTQGFDFLSQQEILEDIETYYKEIYGKMIISVHLLEVFNSEENSNFMYVYFLESKMLLTRKDFYSNIKSGNAPVMMAIYTYSYLKGVWRLKTIRRAEPGLIFKVD